MAKPLWRMALLAAGESLVQRQVKIPSQSELYQMLKHLPQKKPRCWKPIVESIDMSQYNPLDGQHQDMGYALPVWMGDAVPEVQEEVKTAIMQKCWCWRNSHWWCKRCHPSPVSLQATPWTLGFRNVACYLRYSTKSQLQRVRRQRSYLRSIPSLLRLWVRMALLESILMIHFTMRFMFNS